MPSSMPASARVLALAIAVARAHIGCPPDCGEDGRERPGAHLSGPTGDLGEMNLMGKEPDVPATELTPGTWDKKTKGKMIFVKFYAPWCSACKSVKPQWDKLTEEFEDDSSAGIFDVDCINVGQSLCNDLSVHSYPTFKYGDPSSRGQKLEEYKGPRDFESLRKFASDNLVPQCAPTNEDVCTSAEKKAMKFYMSKSEEYLQSEMDRLDKELDEREEQTNTKRHDFAARAKKFNEAMEAAEKSGDDDEEEELASTEEELNKMASEIRNEMDALQQSRKDSGYNLMKAVLQYKRAPPPAEKKKKKKKAKKSSTDASNDLSALKRELQAISLGKLKKRARQEGIAESDIEAFDDEDDPKAAAVKAITDAVAKAQGKDKKPSSQDEL